MTGARAIAMITQRRSSLQSPVRDYDWAVLPEQPVQPQPRKAPQPQGRYAAGDQCRAPDL